jgi:hypothetical protein
VTTTRYLSPTGDDAADGLTPATAWQTIDRLNADTSWGEALLEGFGVFTGSVLAQDRSVSIGSYGAGKAVIRCGDSYGVRTVNCDVVQIQDLHVYGSGVTQGVTTSRHAGVEVLNPATHGQLTSVTLTDLDIEHCYEPWEIRGHALTPSDPKGSGYARIHVEEIVSRDTVYNAGMVRVVPLLDAAGKQITWDQFDMTAPPSLAGNYWGIWKGLAFGDGQPGSLYIGRICAVRPWGDPAWQGVPIHTGDGLVLRNCLGLKRELIWVRDAGMTGTGPEGNWDQWCQDTQDWYSVSAFIGGPGVRGTGDWDGIGSDEGSVNSQHFGCVAMRCWGAGLVFSYFDTLPPSGSLVGCVAIDCNLGGGMSPIFTDGCPVTLIDCHVIETAQQGGGGVVTVDFTDAAAWDAPVLNNPGGSVTPALPAASVTIDGAQLGSVAFYGPDTTLLFGATFHPTAAYQHGGFGLDYSGLPWVMFSTREGGGLYARTNGTDTLLPGSWLGAPHQFKVIWAPDSVRYFIDDMSTPLVTHNVAVDASLRVVFSDAFTGDGALTVG